MRIFSSWRARVAPAISNKNPPTDIFGRLLPYCEELETLAAKYNVWRLGSHESTPALARRAALAICESIESKSQDIAAMEAELDIVLGYER